MSNWWGPFLLMLAALAAAELQLNVTSPIITPVSSLRINLTETNATSPQPVVFMEGQTTNKTSLAPLPPSVYMEGQKTDNKYQSTTSTSPLSNENFNNNTTKEVSSVHARKGVDDPPGYSVQETSSTTSKPNVTSATTAKIIPKKPTVTVGGNDPADLEPPQPPSQSVTLEVSPSSPTSKKIASDPSPKSISEYLKIDKASTVPYSSDVHVVSNSYFDRMTRSQPGFIIPLIISMFAVPVLALIGYQAIRRGKEAWRNRHYRRMDNYLIDGMYNDA